MQFVATITHPINLGIGDDTWILEAANYLEAMQALGKNGKLKDARKIELAKAKPLAEAAT